MLRPNNLGVRAKQRRWQTQSQILGDQDCLGEVVTILGSRTERAQLVQGLEPVAESLPLLGLGPHS